MTAEMDDRFFHSSAHIDKSLKEKNEKGEYIDLVKLLLKEKVLHSSCKLNMVNRDARFYFVPANEKEPPTINSLRWWEQAFEVYVTIYTQVHPERSSELLWYSFNIRTATSTFIWDNVYNYESNFRYLMKDYPTCNWGTVYQQGWSLYFKQKLDQDHFNFSRGGGRRQHKRSGRGNKEMCWKYNHGKCNYEETCCFLHRCTQCLKDDHRYNNCPNKKDRATSSASSNQN